MLLALVGLNLLHILGLIGITVVLGLVLRRHCGLKAVLWMAAYLVLSTGTGLAQPSLLNRALVPLRDATRIGYVGSPATVIELHVILSYTASIFSGIAALVIGLLVAGDAVRLLEHAGIRTENPGLRLMARMSGHPHGWGAGALCISLFGPVVLYAAHWYFTAMANGTLP